MLDNIQTDIKKYWNIIFSQKYLFIAVSLLILSVIVWGSFFMPEVYEAQTTVLVEKNVIDSFIKDITVMPSIEERVRSIAYTITSRNLLLKVINKLALNVNKNNPSDMENLIKKFQEKTKIKVASRRGRETDWFSITYTDRDPIIARDYVNTLVRLFVEENVSAKREESFEANEFLTNQRNFFKEKLDAAEEKIVNFRKFKDIFIAIDERTIVAEIKNTMDKIEGIKTQKMELDAKKNLTEQQIKQEKPYTVTTLGTMKGGSLSNKLLILHNKLNDLLIKYTENYPEVVKVKAEIETLNKQMQDKPLDSDMSDVAGLHGDETQMTSLNPHYEKLKEELSNINRELAAISAQERHLNMFIETKKEYLRNIPTEKKKLADLERDRDLYKKIDEELVVKLGQTEVLKQIEMANKADTFRIVDLAVLPTKPISPNRVIIIFFGFFAGIAGGIGAVFLRYNIDDSVKTIDDLKKLFTAPVLAVVPKIVTKEETNKKKRIDKTVYAVSIAYLSIIGVVFIREFIIYYVLQR